MDPLDEVFDESSEAAERWVTTVAPHHTGVRDLLPDGIPDDLWWVLFDAAPVAYGLLDVAAGTVHANDAAHRMFGYEPGEMRGMSADVLTPPDDENFTKNRALLDSSVGSRFEGAKRYIRKDGSQFWARILASVLREDDGRPQLVLAAIEDVTDRVQALERLESSEESREMTETRFRHLIENISDTVTLMDGSGKVMLSTGNVRSILGFTTDFWDDVNLFDLVHPDDLEMMRENLVELLATPGKEMIGEARVRNVDGDWIDAEINAVNLLEDPAVKGIVLTTRNVTARKRHEVELAQARDQAVRALQMRTEFIASVSHELRTPIHGVLGLAELLVTADLDEEARGLALSISRATESLRMVLDDILDFSKIEVGRLEINHEPAKSEEIGRDLGALFGAQARAKGVELVIEKSADFPEWVMTDGLRVRQVLNNLVSNAIKFTFEGEVRVTADRGPGADGDLIRVTVRDTGIGIAAEQFDRLFEPFSQAHESTRDFGGTGLGLSIARRLVELMGGRLEFTSTVGVGSEFWFTLPLVEASAPSDADLFERGSDGRRRVAAVHVMVVEDNPINQLLVRRQLERLGYSVDVYDAGIAAIEAFVASKPDVVLMDWQLPGIDGLETTRRLRQWEVAEDQVATPIVAMTASALPGDKAKCLEAGMDDFIAKPVSLATLETVVGRWTRGSDGDHSDDGRADGAGSVGARAGRVRDGDGTGLRRSERWADADEAGLESDDVSEHDARASIERDVLDRLIDQLADPLLVITVARTYLRELSGRINAMDAAMTSDDRAMLASAAHTLKSTSAAVGALTLSDLCLKIEQTARLSTTVPMPVSRQRLMHAVKRARLGLELTIDDIEREQPARPRTVG